MLLTVVTVLCALTGIAAKDYKKKIFNTIRQKTELWILVHRLSLKRFSGEQ